MDACSFKHSEFGKEFWLECRLTFYCHTLDPFWRDGNLSKYSLQELTEIASKAVNTTHSLLSSDDPKRMHRWLMDLAKANPDDPDPVDGEDEDCVGEDDPDFPAGLDGKKANLTLYDTTEWVETPAKFFEQVKQEFNLDLYALLNEHINRLRAVFVTSPLFNPSVQPIPNTDMIKNLTPYFDPKTTIADYNNLTSALALVYPKPEHIPNDLNMASSRIILDISTAYELTNSVMPQPSRLADFPVSTRQAVGLVLNMIGTIYLSIFKRPKGGMVWMQTRHGSQWRSVAYSKAVQFIQMSVTDGPGHAVDPAHVPKGFFDSIMSHQEELICEEYRTIDMVRDYHGRA